MILSFHCLTPAKVLRTTLCLLVACLPLAGQAAGSYGSPQVLQVADLPLITRLQRGDSLFDQLSADLATYYKARAKKAVLPSLVLMRYQVKEGETLYSVAARLNLPHSTLVSLNHLSNPSQVSTGREMVVPNLPGIYLPVNPRSQLEQLLANRLQGRLAQGETIRFRTAQALEEFRYFPSEDFSPKERLAFLGSLFRSPLASYRLSSTFGPRRNPISGQLIQHNGLDMVAPSGTPVLATADGIVLEIGHDQVYGNFLIIDHSGGYESVYSHLSKVLVRKGQAVLAGESVAAVGTSGQTTGAHLHFEIHFNGSPRDPLRLIKN